MSTFVRTNHTTFSLHQISKMVAVLLLIFFPVIALANPAYQSSNRYSNPSTVGASSMQYQLESYKMANTSNYQMSTTLNPAQTVYTPFSNENPYSDANTGNNGPARINGRKNTGDGWVDSGEEGRSEESPIGEPWILLAFAAAAAVVITLRKKQTA